MGTGSIIKTDLYAINGIVQNTMLSYAKELFIETLREEFSKESYYHYVRDPWGFPKTIDLTDVPIDAGLHNDVTTRIFIGEAFRYDMKFFPAVLVRAGSFKSVPISMSRNEGVIKYKATRVLDGYGNEKIFSVPSYFSLAGAWEGTVTIDILAGDIKSRDDITEIISSILTITNFKIMANAGVVVKPISIGSPSEADDYKDKIYKITISCDVRTEWEQNIPISSVVDAINFCIEFGVLNKNPIVTAPNLEIHSSIDIIDIIQDM
jgi:hypothetical protein